MKLILNKHADKVLIAIGYIENYLKHYQNENGLFSINIGEVKERETLSDYESIKKIQRVLDAIVEKPPMYFSKPIDKTEYLRNSNRNIQLIFNNYLKAKGTNFKEGETKSIRKGLKEFYKSSEHRLLFSYSSFDATQHDRIAHQVLTIGFSYLMTPFVQLIADVINNNNSDVKQNDEDEISFDDLFDEYTSDTELKDPLIGESRITSKSINKIYSISNSLLPEISGHKKRVLTWYIALGYGLISMPERPKR